jgi:hypothetical protein
MMANKYIKLEMEGSKGENAPSHLKKQFSVFQSVANYKSEANYR